MYLRGLNESESLEAVRLSFPELTRLGFAESLERIEDSLSSHQAWLLASRRIREISLSTPWRDGGSRPPDPADLRPNPEEMTQRREETDALLRALEALPAEQRLLLKMRFESELTFEEIASIEEALARLGTLMESD